MSRQGGPRKTNNRKRGARQAPRRRRILVVEDSPTQAERLRFVLEGAGYEVDVAADGRGGLQAIGSSPPDLIVSDIVMPGMDGYELCRIVKTSAATREIPFVLLTGQRTPADIIKGLERGADNFITKPFEDDYLLERVRRIFEHLEHRRRGRFEMEVALRVGGHEIVLNADKQQMIELLFATSEELADANDQLAQSKRLIEEHARTLEDRVQERTRQLAEAEALYRHLLESVNAIVWRADAASLRFTFVSPESEKILGYAPARWIAEPSFWQEHIHPEDRDWVVPFRKKATEEGRDHQIEYRMTASDGRTVWLQDLVRVVDPAGHAKALVGVMADVSERRGLEEQLRQSQKMEAVGRLAGGVAHDFNNLLGVITGYGELLLRDPGLDPMRRSRVEQVVRAAQRAASLTRQLLAFSRRQVLEPKLLDLNAVVAGVEEMLRRLIGEDIQLVTRLAPGLARVKADPGQIEQVIVNLAVNARDAMPGGGKLILETARVDLDAGYTRNHAGSRAGPHVVLAVSDTGSGMDAETQSHLFEPFFTTKEQGKGTGLGLSTVYGIVKQSGGHIGVYSEPGRGSTFKVYLPRTEEAEEAEPARETEAAALSTGSETVLVVEDEEALREMTREILQEGGYTVLEAGGLEEALAAGRSHQGPIHLLLTDVVMPGTSGRGVAERLRAERPEMRALYMSGYTDEAISHHGVLEAGMPFLQKPFTPEALLRKVREVLDRR